LILFFKKEGLW